MGRGVTVEEVAEKAVEVLIDNEWIQHCSARDGHGVPIMARSQYAKSFCMGGAIDRAVFLLQLDTLAYKNAVKRVVYLLDADFSPNEGRVMSEMVRFNDDSLTTKEDVLLVLKKVAAGEGKREGEDRCLEG